MYQIPSQHCQLSMVSSWCGAWGHLQDGRWQFATRMDPAARDARQVGEASHAAEHQRELNVPPGCGFVRGRFRHGFHLVPVIIRTMAESLSRPANISRRSD